MVPKYRIVIEDGTVKQAKESNCGLMKDFYCNFWKGLRKRQKIPVRIAAVTVIIQNGHLPRSRLQGYLCNSIFG
jgi:hypothetical protein